MADLLQSRPRRNTPIRLSPERYRRQLISEKNISPEYAAALTIAHFGSLYTAPTEVEAIFGRPA